MQEGRIRFDLRGIAIELKERRLAVPFYQRAYAWSVHAPGEEVAEYWGDLRAAFSENTPEYFLGTIVLTKEGAQPRDTIIDGQQRLATTSILLAAIRDEYRVRGDDKRAEIVQGEYLSTSDLASASATARLILSSEDAHFFEKRIIDGGTVPSPSKPSHELILEAYNYLRDEIKKVADDAGPDWAARLYQWVDFLGLRVKSIVLEVPTEADAFLIFETLNDRGADLTIADLLKNYLFGHAGSKLEVVRDTWMQVLGALELSSGNALFTTFLRHYWSSLYGAVRERELYKNVKDHVATEAQVVAFLNDLQAAAVLYSALLSAGHEYWEGLGGTVRENAETLLRLELVQHRPLLLAALQHFTTKEKKKLLRALVSWGVRGLIVGGIGGGTAEKSYCRAAVNIRKGAIKTASEVLTEISSIVPSDDEFKAVFSVARVPKSRIGRYLLIVLERIKSGEKEPELVPNSNEEEVNLEHVLPKRATASDWGKEFSGDERKDYVYRLGNLALLQKGPNGRIGNKPFSIKKPILKKSSFKLTSEISSVAEWTKITIGERQERLAALAVRAWPRS